MLSESHTSFVYTILSFVLYIGLFIASQFEKPKQIEINIPNKLKLEEIKLNFEKKKLFEENKIVFERFNNRENLMCMIKPKNKTANPQILDKIKKETINLNDRARDIKSRVRIKKAVEKAHHEIVDKKKL